MFSAGYSRMESEYSRRVGRLPEKFEGIAESAVRQVRIQIGLLLNNLQAVTVRDRTGWAALNKKIELQRSVKSLALAWAAQWRAPKHEEAAVEAEPLDIPAEFVEEPQEEDKPDPAADGERVKSESDSDSDSEDED